MDKVLVVRAGQNWNALTECPGKSNEKIETDDSEVEEDFVFSLLTAHPENTTTELNSPLSNDELLRESQHLRNALQQQLILPLVIDYQATQLIANSSNPLLAFTQLSQNFPKYSNSVARRVSLNESVLEEIQRNNLKVQAGAYQVWLNGLALQDADINPYG